MTLFNGQPDVLLYIYISSRDEELARQSWKKLLSYIGLQPITSSLSFSEVTREKERRVYTLTSKESSDCFIKLNMFEDIYFINLSYIAPSDTTDSLVRFYKEKTKQIDELFSVLSEEMPQVLGISIVFVNHNQDSRTKYELEKLFESDNFKTSITKLGHLHFQENITDSDEHIYFLNSADQTDCTHFINLIFPQIEILSFRLQRSKKMLTRQIKWIKEKRIESDKKVDETLKKKEFDNLGQPTNLIEYLEEEIKKLTEAYSSLTSNVQLIRDYKHSYFKNLERLKSLLGSELDSPENKCLFNKHLFKDFQGIYDSLSEEEVQASLSLDRCQSAISLIHTNIDLMQSQRNIEVQKQNKKLLNQTLQLQEEGISLQVAATFIEFIIIFYYTTSLWEKLATAEKFHHIPAYQVFLTISVFDIGSIILTHYIAKSMRERKNYPIALFSSFLILIISFVFIIALTNIHN